MPLCTDVQASSAAMSWLLTNGIGERLWTLYGIGYAEKLDRCIIPITHAGSTSGFIARSLDPRQQPKYLTRFKGDALGYFYSRDLGGPARHRGKLSTGLDLVLTEDAVSAIRVGEHIQTAGLLGTTLGGREAALWSDLALCDNPTIGLWLDPDAAGKRKRAEIRRQLILMGADVRIINSDRDPKLYSDDQIQEFLTG
jgi:DNA primase